MIKELRDLMVKKVLDYLFVVNCYDLISIFDGMDLMVEKIVEDIEKVLGVGIE